MQTLPGAGTLPIRPSRQARVPIKRAKTAESSDCCAFPSQEPARSIQCAVRCKVPFRSVQPLNMYTRPRRRQLQSPSALPEALQIFSQNSLARDTAATIISLVCGVVLVKIFDFLQYSGTLNQKVSRKWMHILAGPGLMCWWPLYSNAPYARFFASLVPSLNLLRLLLIGTGVVDDEGAVNAVTREGDRRELLRGPLFYVVVLMAATMVYWRDSPIGITAVAVMAGGDGFADLVGRRFGTAKLPHNPRKSWIGSLAMLLGGWAVAVLFIAFFQRLEFFECTLWAIAGSVGAIAAASAFFESLPVDQWVDDNLSVPLLAALLGQCLFTKGALLIA